MSEAEAHLLAPGGRLRIGIAVGPAMSALWTERDPATGKARGVTVALGAAIAEAVGLPFAYVEYDSSGKIIEAAALGQWDITFTPVDAERKKHVLFWPNYFLGESTYMVPAGSPIRTLDEVDRAGVRAVGVEGTATIRSARRVAKNVEVLGVLGLNEAMVLFAEGKADAIALGRESLVSLLPKFPGARILDGHFHAAGTAVAVPLDRPAALLVVTRLMEQFKSDGTLRRFFDENGMADAEVAPLGSQS